MKKQIKNKSRFTSKIAVYVLFAFILLLELINMIVVVAQASNKIHWMVFFIYLTLILLTTGSFLFFHFKKINWMRGFISTIIFIDCIYTFAYSFNSYPKTPDGSYASFIFYILYGCLIFSVFVNLIVLNAHISEERDASAFKAFVIQAIIFTVISAIFFFYAFAQLCSKGYTAAMLVDMFSYASACLTIWYIIHIQKISMPLVIEKYYSEPKKVRGKK